MAYDRYDTRGEGRRERWRSEDRYDRDYGRERGWRGRDDDRGFFERAGDEIASWFGDDEAERRRRYDERSDGRRRDRGGWFGRGSDEGDYRGDYRRDYDEDRGRDRGWFGSGRDDDRDDYRRGDYDPDDRYGVGRVFGSRPGLSSEGYRSGPPGGDRAFGPGFGSTGTDDHDYRPMAGDYGRFDPTYRDLADRSGDAPRHRYRGDREYADTRRRHMEEFDRDYDDYRRERQSRFEEDFGGWRERRQQKRGLLGQVREHMEVVGSDNQHVGTVDRVAGDRIILTRSDPESGDTHHSLSCTDIDRVEKDKLILDLPADKARERWRDDTRERSLLEREDQGEAGPHMLDRSFSGTYRNR